MKKVLFIVITVLLFSIIGLLFFANSYVNDGSIPTKELAVSGDRVLAVFAHPDDEITISGTLARLNSKNISTGIIYLTRGEKGPTGGIVPKEKLGEERTKEVHSMKKALGIDYLKVFDFPDSGITNTPAESIKKTLLKCLNEYKPTVVIGFDITVGLYGHEDHRLAGLYLKQVLEQANLKHVNKYYMVTLPKPMIQLALKMSKIFRDRYPKDPEKGLPDAHLAVSIWEYGSYKKMVLQAHKTQWEIINDVQPYGMTIPSVLYYRIFDREYFHEVKLK